MESATVVSWLAKVGAPGKAGDVVVVGETAKAATEIEAGRDGVLVAILAPEGAEVGIGAVLGRVADSLAADEVAVAAPQPATVEPEAVASEAPIKAEAASRRVSISPLARRLAHQAGLDTSSIAGTGPGGRIKSRDIERALRERTEAPPAVAPDAVVHSPALAKAGSAVPLVLLHGFGANAAAWNMVRPHLDGRPVLTPELPGHGREQALASPTLEALAEAALGQIEASGARDCDLVGHSLGGAVAAVLS
eukprot:gene30885-39775_t